MSGALPYSAGGFVALSGASSPREEGERREADTDGAPVTPQTREEFGQRWLWLMVPEGDHQVQVSWAQK